MYINKERLSWCGQSFYFLQTTYRIAILNRKDMLNEKRKLFKMG
jgi:hypothetical protein